MMIKLKIHHSRISKDLLEEILVQTSDRSNNSLRGLATKLNISTSQFNGIIKLLREEKIIKNWNIVVNPKIYPKMKILFFLLKTNPTEPEVIEKLLSYFDNDTLKHIEGITGTFSLIGQFHYDDSSQFLSSLEYLYSLAGKTGFQKYQIIEVIDVFKISGFCCPKITKSLRSSENEKFLKISKLVHQADMPLTSYQIAKYLNISQPAIAKLFKKWKDDNFILGYSIETNYWNKNYIHSYIQVKAPLGRYQEVIDFCLERTDVLDIFRTNHEYSLLLKTRFSSLNELNSFLKSLFFNSFVEDTITIIVLDFLR